MKFFKQIGSNESGATAIEYGLIAALIAIVAIVGFQALFGDDENSEVDAPLEMQSEAGSPTE